MKPVLPFVCAPNDRFASLWVNALQQAMPEEKVLMLSELDAQARAACEVAIVANPRPEDVRSLPNLIWVQSVWAGVSLAADRTHAGGREPTDLGRIARSGQPDQLCTRPHCGRNGVAHGSGQRPFIACRTGCV